MVPVSNIKNDWRASPGGKKKLEVGAFEAARRGETGEALIGNVFLARRINQVLGGAFVTPWDVDNLPESAIDQILSIQEIGGMRAGMKQVEDAFSRWRGEHAGKQH